MVMRMNLNQQSRGKPWATHRALRKRSPKSWTAACTADTSVHRSPSTPLTRRHRPRLTEGSKPGMYNYGQLQVTFEDGSVGWYEAGWGPMMSETAFFVKDVVGPEGSASIVDRVTGEEEAASDIDSHQDQQILFHHAARDENDEFLSPDEWIDTTDEPDHDGLCLREQQLFARAIAGTFDPSGTRGRAQRNRIVLAADRSHAGPFGAVGGSGWVRVRVPSRRLRPGDLECEALKWKRSPWILPGSCGWRPLDATRQSRLPGPCAIFRSSLATGRRESEARGPQWPRR